MKIAFFELKKWEGDYIRERLRGKNVSFFKGKLNSKNVGDVKNVESVVVFIYSDLSKKVLSQMPKLKYVATMSTGFDHIDLEYCKERDIKVSNVPHYGENTVAEQAFALILALSRKIFRAVKKTKDEDFSLNGLMGFDLKGKTLGVIGPGSIGQHVIKIAKGFEMNVIVYGRGKDMKLSKKLGFKWVSLDELLKKSDIFTIHVPLNKGTKHLINMNNIKLVKKGAFLINTARGDIVDNDALIYGLDNGILAGAGLDVLEGEKIKEERELLDKGKNDESWKIWMQNHMLLKDKNVIVTPHSAFFTKEALERILDTSIANVKGFVSGRIRNRVN